MNCFMSYNPNVAKEVKITTWIKEFDGASPVYPSFPNEGDCFIVFDTDEAKEPSVNKTYTSGEWADTSSGGGGEMDMPTFTVTFGDGGSATATCDKTYSECKELCDSNYFYTSPCIVVLEGDFTGQGYSTMLYDYLGDTEKINVYFTVNDVNGAVEYSADGTLSAYIDY